LPLAEIRDHLFEKKMKKNGKWKSAKKKLFEHKAFLKTFL